MNNLKRDIVKKGKAKKSAHQNGDGKNHIFAIAIDDYIHCSKLNNAVYDTKCFIEVLKKRFIFDDENITFLKNEEATKKKIELEFVNLVNKINRKDNLVIYFSGHGRYHESLGGYWVPQDASPNDWTDLISNNSIKGYLEGINPFHLFLIVDSCFSGSLLMSTEEVKHFANRQDNLSSRWGLTSGKKELVSDGPAGSHSPFAFYLLKLFENTDTSLSVMNICSYVKENVSTNHMQTPLGSILKIVGHEGGEMIFHLRPIENDAWDRAKNENTISSYYKFIVNHPNSRYIENALNEINLIENQINQEWDKTDKKSIAALLNFKIKYPNTSYLKEIDSLIQDLSPFEETSASDPQLLIRENLFAEKYLLAINQENAGEYYLATLFYKEALNLHDKSFKVSDSELIQKIKDCEILQKNKNDAQARTEKERLSNQLVSAFKEREQKFNNLFNSAIKLLESNDYTRAKIIFEELLTTHEHPFRVSEQDIKTQIKGCITAEEKRLILNKYTNGQVIKDAKFTPEMVFVEGGTFYMGNDDGGKSDQSPLHKVMISSFLIAKYPVTFLEYDRFCLETHKKQPDDNGWGRDRRPVINVTWHDAFEYCKWLSKITGESYCLPSEAQWEFAARGGILDDGHVLSGNNCWCINNSIVGGFFNNKPKTQKVGNIRANGLGLHDMSGNVWEWCYDGYDKTYYRKSPLIDPVMDGITAFKSVRGGSFSDPVSSSYIFYRSYRDPLIFEPNLGFRVARIAVSLVGL